MDEQRLREHAEWIKTACLAHGSSVSTAYLVAGTFVQAFEDQRAPAGAGGDRRDG